MKIKIKTNCSNNKFIKTYTASPTKRKESCPCVFSCRFHHFDVSFPSDVWSRAGEVRMLNEFISNVDLLRKISSVSEIFRSWWQKMWATSTNHCLTAQLSKIPINPTQSGVVTELANIFHNINIRARAEMKKNCRNLYRFANFYFTRKFSFLSPLPEIKVFFINFHSKLLVLRAIMN